MRYQLRFSGSAGNRVMSTHRGVVVGCQTPFLGGDQSSHRPSVEPARFSVYLNLPGADAAMEHRANGLSQFASDFELSWGWCPSSQVALDWAGQLLRVHGVRPAHLADRLPLPNPGVHGAVPHVARQQAVLEDAPRDGIRNQELQSCASCGCGAGCRGRPVGGRMPGDGQGAVGPRGRDC